MENKPGEVIAENLTEEQKAEAEAKAAAEAEAKAKADAESPYKKQLEQLEVENRQKAGALEEERKKRLAAEAAAKALAEANTAGDSEKNLSTEELKKWLDAKFEARDFDQQLAQFTGDVEEQKLIKAHYETSIIRTGNIAEDLKKAAAIANSHLVEQAKKAQAEREASEAFGTGFQGGSSSGHQAKPAYTTDPIAKGAAQLLEKFGRKDSIKYL